MNPIIVIVLLFVLIIFLVVAVKRWHHIDLSSRIAHVTLAAVAIWFVVQSDSVSAYQLAVYVVHVTTLTVRIRRAQSISSTLNGPVVHTLRLLTTIPRRLANER